MMVQTKIREDFVTSMAEFFATFAAKKYIKI